MVVKWERISYYFRHMNIIDWQYRYQKATLTICLGLITWALIGVFTSSFGVTSYWGVGLAVVFLWLFALGLFVRQFGFKKGALGLLMILAVITGFLILNQLRGWPFGFRTFHDILGWKMSWGISWPIPVFWTFVMAASLLINQPKQKTSDHKKLFSWAFDSSIMVLATSFIVEPILANTSAVAWSMPGAVLGVPFSSFVGWFIVSFVACSLFVFLLKPSLEQKISQNPLLIVLLGLSFLGLAVSHVTRLSLIKIFSILAVLSLLGLLYWSKKTSVANTQTQS